MTTSQNQDNSQKPNSVNTDGGAFIGGDANVGGDMISRDQNVQGDYVRGDKHTHYHNESGAVQNVDLQAQIGAVEQIYTDLVINIGKAIYHGFEVLMTFAHYEENDPDFVDQVMAQVPQDLAGRIESLKAALLSLGSSIDALNRHSVARKLLTDKFASIQSGFGYIDYCAKKLELDLGPLSYGTRLNLMTFQQWLQDGQQELALAPGQKVTLAYASTLCHGEHSDDEPEQSGVLTWLAFTGYIIQFMEVDSTSGEPYFVSPGLAMLHDLYYSLPLGSEIIACLQDIYAIDPTNNVTLFSEFNPADLLDAQASQAITELQQRFDLFLFKKPEEDAEQLDTEAATIPTSSIGGNQPSGQIGAIMDPSTIDINPLVEILLSIPSIQDGNTRNDVIAELPAYIANNIQRRPASRPDVRNLVKTCLNYAGGLEALYNILAENYEGQSIGIQNLRRALDELDLPAAQAQSGGVPQPAPEAQPNGIDWKNLSGPQQGAFLDAMLHAYTSRSPLQQMLLFKMNVQLNQIDRGGTMRDVVTDVIGWCIIEGRTEELYRSALEDIPRNPALLDLEGKLSAFASS